MDRFDRKINFNYWIIMLNYRNGFVMIERICCCRTGYWVQLLIINDSSVCRVSLFNACSIMPHLRGGAPPASPTAFLFLKLKSKQGTWTFNCPPHMTNWFVVDWAITITATTSETDKRNMTLVVSKQLSSTRGPRARGMPHCMSVFHIRVKSKPA